MTHDILYLNRISEIGGAERSLLLLLSGIDRGKFWPTVVLPEAIEELLSNQELRISLGRNAREKIVQKFGAQKHIYKIAKLFNNGSVRLSLNDK